MDPNQQQPLNQPVPPQQPVAGPPQPMAPQGPMPPAPQLNQPVPPPNPQQPMQQPPKGASVGYIAKITAAVLAGYFLIGVVFGFGSALLSGLSGPNFVATEAEDDFAPFTVMHPEDWQLNSESSFGMTFETGATYNFCGEDDDLIFDVSKVPVDEETETPGSVKEGLENDSSIDEFDEVQYFEGDEYLTVTVTFSDQECFSFGSEEERAETYSGFAAATYFWDSENENVYLVSANVGGEGDGIPSLGEVRSTIDDVRKETVKANPDIF